jgi:hypothetical protein
MLRRLTDAVKLLATDSPSMYARAVDEAGARLQALRHEEWLDFALGAFTLGLAMAATEFIPQLAVPLLVGGLTTAVLGMRALWRHWDLVDRLAGERDAYTIAEVFAYASREATMDRRRTSAAIIRNYLQPSVGGAPALRDGAAFELEALAGELEDDDLELDPACAVACLRLVTEHTQSPLLNSAMPRESLRSSAHRIRTGFTARQQAS